jgi:hypothetical protein
MDDAQHALGYGIPIRFDPVGDFLSAYAGPARGDLDVVMAGAFLSGPDEVVLSGTHAGLIGTTPGAAYVWGIDRGAGAELLTMLDPPVGEGVVFDAVVVVLPDGTGSFIDLAGGGAPQALDPSSVSISGPTISVTLPRSLLPSQGFDFADYAYNLWPRFAPDGVDPGDNTQISDFAPDASTFVARPYGPDDDETPVLYAHGDASGGLADLTGQAGDGGAAMLPVSTSPDYHLA